MVSLRLKRKREISRNNHNQKINRIRIKSTIMSQNHQLMLFIRRCRHSQQGSSSTKLHMNPSKTLKFSRKNFHVLQTLVMISCHALLKLHLTILKVSRTSTLIIMHMRQFLSKKRKRGSTSTFNKLKKTYTRQKL